MRFESATIYEPKEGGVKRAYLESGRTRKEYDEFMDKLAGCYPERYLLIRERYIEEREDEPEAPQPEDYLRRNDEHRNTK